MLLLERDGIAVDHALHDSLVGQGISVSVAPGDGYAAMSSHPQLAQPPSQLIRRVTTWLDGFSAPTAAPAGVSPRPSGAGDSARIPVGETVVTESALTVQQSFGTIEGILASPPHAPVPGLCAVLLNAGAVRRIGPSRMWVEAARRWAANGIGTLRLDVMGIGDADGDASPYTADSGLYVPELIPQVLATAPVRSRCGPGRSRFRRCAPSRSVRTA